MERPSYETTFSITIVKSAASNQEYTLTLIVRGFFLFCFLNPITTFMLQEIPVLQKINDQLP